VGGLNFNANCVDVTVKPGEAGKPAKVSLVPSGAAVKLVNQTTSTKKHSARVSRTKGGDTMIVAGSVARSECWWRAGFAWVVTSCASACA
jgi:hypothetical protein